MTHRSSDRCVPLHNIEFNVYTFFKKKVLFDDNKLQLCPTAVEHV